MRIWTLIQLQLIELRRNMMIAMAPMMVLVMAAMFAVMERKAPDMAGMGQSMILSLAVFMVGWQLISISMAEEKEKRTLEALMLTPVKSWEIIMSKVAFAAALSLIVALATVPLFGKLPANPGLALGAFMVALLFTLSGGVIMGLILPDTRSIGSVGTIVVLFFFFSGFPVIKMLSSTTWAYMQWLPGRPLYDLLHFGVTGDGDFPNTSALVLLAYTVVAVALALRQFRRQATAL